MKIFFKIIGLLMLLLILGSIASYLYLTDFGRNNILSQSPRRARLEIPVTYNIDWWANQEALSVDSLIVEVVESKLNLFNSESLISYHVNGHLNSHGYWQPSIKEIHICERINSDTTLHCDRIIEITPIVITKEKNNLNNSIESFQFTNEHSINSNHWGVNRIKFLCGGKEKTIELFQGK
jgi:hypothetical protein